MLNKYIFSTHTSLLKGLFVSWSICLSILQGMSICLLICPSVYLSSRLQVGRIFNLNVLSVCLSIYISPWYYIAALGMGRLSVCPSSIYPTIMTRGKCYFLLSCYLRSTADFLLSEVILYQRSSSIQLT